MSKKVYMLQDDLGNLVTIDVFDRERNSCLGGEWYESYADAKEDAEVHSLHVVTLTIEDTKVVLPDYVAKFVKEYKGTIDIFVTIKLMFDDLECSNYTQERVNLYNWVFAQHPNTTNRRVKLLMKLLDKNDHTKIVVEGAKKYRVPFTGFRTSDGEQQYLSYRDGDWFASRRNEAVQQEFTEKQLLKAPKWVSEGTFNREEVKYDERL